MDFDPPFGSQSGRRNPTEDEKINGFPCGPADQTLFNGLMYRFESELGNLITYAGLTQTDADPNQVRKAVQALIAAATGGGDTSQFVLMTQARARLPIFPEFLTSDFKINVTSPATGTVRLPGGINFMHRGIFQIATVQTDFNTAANATYHLRWNPTDGYTLKNLADTGYNPSAAAETSVAFDSKYDDMLIARVTTNSGNIATITNLANAHDLRTTGQEQNARGAFSGGGVSAGYEDGVGPNTVANYNAISLNWARTPMTYITAINDVWANGGFNSTTPGAGEWSAGVRPLSRYQIAVWGQGDVDIWTGWAART